METLTVSGHHFELTRVPRAGKRPLRAWDAADEYVLDHLAEVFENSSAPRSVLIIGDSFGALSCGLADWAPTVVAESAAQRHAITENLERNEKPRVDFATITDAHTEVSTFDLVVIKIPKSTAHLVEILHWLRPHVNPSSQIVAAAMAKHIQGSTIEVIEETIGEATTSLAKKKARLISVAIDSAAYDPGLNPWPKVWKAYGLLLTNYGGGFSPNKLDPGTSLLLDTVRNIEEQIDVSVTAEDPLTMVDLGCGNGVIGLRVASLLNGAGITNRIIAVDDSMLAIAAARQSWEHHLTTSGSSATPVEFHHAHRLANVVDPRSVDLVVVNPPFHDDRVLGDDTAWSMFVDAHKALRIGGTLIVVGNRHLAYHAKLKKIFGGTDTLASNAKFVVHRSVKSAKTVQRSGDDGVARTD